MNANTPSRDDGAQSNENSSQGSESVPVDLPSNTSSPPLSTGAYVPSSRDDFTLLRPHAEGGLGEVWVAHDEKLQREVAVKKMKPERRGEPALRARFLNEVRITGQLEHPNVVPVYQLVEGEKGEPFYAMKLVRGQTLAHVIQRFHQSSLSQAERVMEQLRLLTAFQQVCQAVSYAHSRGVIHRDLKPANVILGDYGETIVIDWGLAKVVGEAEDDALPVKPWRMGDTEQTRMGEVVGTPAYMPPEQATGRLDQVDERSDVYALGAMLYELLTGQPPFSGSNMADILRQVRDEAPLSPRRLCKEIPKALQAICLKALRKKKEERYANARALVEDLERYRARLAPAVYAPWHYRAGLWIRRHARELIVGVPMTLAAVVSVSYLFYANYEHREETLRKDIERQEQEQLRIAASREKALQFVKEAERELHKKEFAKVSRALADARGLCENEPALSETLQLVELRGKQVEDYRTFLKLSYRALAMGYDLANRPSSADGIEGECRKALAVFNVVDDGDWQSRVKAIPLSASQQEEVRTLAAQVLVGLATRIAHRDEKRPELLEKALGFLERAGEMHSEPPYYVLRLTQYYSLKMGNEAAADRAAVAMKGRPMSSTLDYTVEGKLAFYEAERFNPKTPDFERAMELFLIAIERASDNRNYAASAALSSIYRRQGRKQDAIAALSECLAIHAEDPYALYVRGSTYVALGNPVKGHPNHHYYWLGMFDLNRALKLDPAFGKAYDYRSACHLYLGNYAQAEEDATYALRYGQELPRCYAVRALGRAYLGKNEEAIQDVEKSSDLNRRSKNKSSYSYFLCARALAYVGQKIGDETLDQRSLSLLDDAVRSGFLEADELRAANEFSRFAINPEFCRLQEQVEQRTRIKN